MKVFVRYTEEEVRDILKKQTLKFFGYVDADAEVLFGFEGNAKLVQAEVILNKPMISTSQTEAAVLQISK